MLPTLQGKGQFKDVAFQSLASCAGRVSPRPGVPALPSSPRPRVPALTSSSHPHLKSPPWSPRPIVHSIKKESLVPSIPKMNPFT